jgi:hypothetical protein
MNLNQIKTETTWSEAASSINNNNQKIGIEIEKLQNATIHNKGFYNTYEALVAAHPTANLGDIAYVYSSTTGKYRSYEWDGEFWEFIGYEYTPEMSLDNYLPKTGGQITGDLSVQGSVNAEKVVINNSEHAKILVADGEIKTLEELGGLVATDYTSDDKEYNDNIF